METSEIGGRGSSSGHGISVKHIQLMSKTGTMPPLSQQPVSFKAEKYNLFYEAIERNYEYPSTEYLKASNIDMDYLNEGWKVQKNALSGEMEMWKLIRVDYDSKTGKGPVLRWLHSPLESSPESRIGLEMYGLYHVLSSIGKLDKTQFKRKKE